MRKIRQVLRLASENGLSQREIARSLGISRDAVRDYVVRARSAGLAWPLPEDLSDVQLEHRLFPSVVESGRKPEPDWALVHEELKRKGATLQVLHEEFLQQYPNGIGRSLFNMRYQKWRKGLKVYLRQTHVNGERVFVDYAGPTMPVWDDCAQKFRKAQIFVAVLGASNYMYAEAHWSQRLPDWIAAHVRMFEFFGGAPKIIVCDNLKSAVTKASRTEPIVHSAYQHLAEHYGAFVLPARPRKPKDKAKAEGGVLLLERWVLFRLRKRQFNSLEELNDVIAALLSDLNRRPFQRMPGSRLSQFELKDAPALLPLPVQAFEYAEFHKTKVGLDGCFSLDGVIYSAPHNLARRVIELRVTASTIEILWQGKRVGSHARAHDVAEVIDPSHLRASDRHFHHWQAQNELAWAEQVGPATRKFLAQLLQKRSVKEQGYRAALSMKKLAAEYGPERLEAACARAIAIGAPSPGNLRSILANALDRQPLAIEEPAGASLLHANLRGRDYYH